MTRMPRLTRDGAIFAAASSGSARNTMSDCSASFSAEKGSTAPSQILASAGSVRAGPSGEDDIAAVTRTCGCPASHRSSSCPAKPLAPAMPTRTALPEDARDGAPADSAIEEVSIVKHKYTAYSTGSVYDNSQ